MRPFTVLFLLISVLASNAQFGVPNVKENAAEASIDANGQVDAGENPYAELATRLQSVAPIGIQNAVDLAAIIQAAQADSETKELISKLKTEEGETLKALAKEITAMEIVQGMKQSLEELKAIETLFSDPERAVIEMEKEGLLDKGQADFYKTNPEALADETRKGVYFGFVSMAVAGGYLE